MRLRELLSNLPSPLERALAGVSAPSNLNETRPYRYRNRDMTSFQANRKLQPAEIAALIASYSGGTSIKALGRQFKLHEQTVRAHLERAGVKLRPQQVLSQDQVDEITQLYQAGASLRQLGLQYDVAGNSIRNYLLRAGVQLREARRLPRQATST